MKRMAREMQVGVLVGVLEVGGEGVLIFWAFLEIPNAYQDDVSYAMATLVYDFGLCLMSMYVCMCGWWTFDDFYTVSKIATAF